MPLRGWQCPKVPQGYKPYPHCEMLISIDKEMCNICFKEINRAGSFIAWRHKEISHLDLCSLVWILSSSGVGFNLSEPALIRLALYAGVFFLAYKLVKKL